jgi:hypothetical protein
MNNSWAGERPGRMYPYLRYAQTPRTQAQRRPRRRKGHIARDLAEIASHIGQLKGDANAYLTDSNYDRLKLRLENALSAVEAAPIEARRRVRLNEGR